VGKRKGEGWGGGGGSCKIRFEDSGLSSDVNKIAESTKDFSKIRTLEPTELNDILAESKSLENIHKFN
jgi:hypothetical protein